MRCDRTQRHLSEISERSNATNPSYGVVHNGRAREGNALSGGGPGGEAALGKCRSGMRSG